MAIEKTSEGNTEMFCLMVDCDQDPAYCIGHYVEQEKIITRLNSRVQNGSVIMRALVALLEQEGIRNMDTLAAKDWLTR